MNCSRQPLFGENNSKFYTSAKRQNLTKVHVLFNWFSLPPCHLDDSVRCPNGCWYLHILQYQLNSCFPDREYVGVFLRLCTSWLNQNRWCRRDCLFYQGPYKRRWINASLWTQWGVRKFLWYFGRKPTAHRRLYYTVWKFQDISISSKI